MVATSLNSSVASGIQFARWAPRLARREDRQFLAAAQLKSILGRDLRTTHFAKHNTMSH